LHRRVVLRTPRLAMTAAWLRASPAGHLKLSNLCLIYDNNHITIEGNTRLTFSEDVAARFLAYGWNVLRQSDANDCARLASGAWLCGWRCRSAAWRALAHFVDARLGQQMHQQIRRLSAIGRGGSRPK
jgi:hypothetical protein